MSYFKAKMHQTSRPHWGSSQCSPIPPSWIQGVLLLREGEGGKGKRGRGGARGKGRGREGREGKGCVIAFGD